MPSRVAASLGILAFAICLIVGGVQAGNTFSTTITRALMAMGCTVVVGWIIGWAGQKMIDERMTEVKTASDKLAEMKTSPDDR
jgi:NhaP-type Na+/H+ or K+/H+ antiporter